MAIREILPVETLELRQRLLRPHLTPDTCVYPGDDDVTTTHLGLFIDEALVGIVSLYREALPEREQATGYRFRALAIDDDFRGQGHGMALLKAVESLARAANAEYLWANARITAIDFYRNADYKVGDQEFVVEGVGPHRIVVMEFDN